MEYYDTNNISNKQFVNDNNNNTMVMGYKNVMGNKKIAGNKNTYIDLNTTNNFLIEYDADDSLQTNIINNFYNANSTDDFKTNTFGSLTEVNPINNLRWMPVSQASQHTTSIDNQNKQQQQQQQRTIESLPTYQVYPIPNTASIPSSNTEYMYHTHMGYELPITNQLQPHQQTTQYQKSTREYTPYQKSTQQSTLPKSPIIRMLLSQKNDTLSNQLLASTLQQTPLSPSVSIPASSNVHSELENLFSHSLFESPMELDTVAESLLSSLISIPHPPQVATLEPPPSPILDVETTSSIGDEMDYARALEYSTHQLV